MTNEFMENELVESSEITEAAELANESEIEALEQPIEVPEAANPAKIEIPDSIADVLQLNDTEKKAYDNIGKLIDNMPVEGSIVGYKQGVCSRELIPITK